MRSAPGELLRSPFGDRQARDKGLGLGGPTPWARLQGAASYEVLEYSAVRSRSGHHRTDSAVPGGGDRHVSDARYRGQLSEDGERLGCGGEILDRS